MIDFTNCEKNNFKYYGGKNGGKICVIYNNENYMLKFPAINEGISEHGYSNSCISEYISCHILKTLGLDVQDTLLGKYKINNEEKIVVACKDFTSNGTILKQFAELKNSQIETSKNGYGTELSEVIETIENQNVYDSKLYPQLTDERIAEIIDDENEMEARVYIFPTSALKSNDKKINYFIY